MSTNRWRFVAGAVVVGTGIAAMAYFLHGRSESQRQDQTLAAADREGGVVKGRNRGTGGPRWESLSGTMGDLDADRKPVDKMALSRFIEDYNTPHADERKVFEKYLDSVGPHGMLDFLEEIYPRCHDQAHDLGSAIFAQGRDINQSLFTCGRRCTAGCMHGVVLEAFKDHPIDEVKGQLQRFCEGDTMSEAYKAGNCAHGLGHGLMWASGRNLDEALDACATYPGEAMQYYCATGVYMEYFEEPDEAVDPETVTLHYPCDTYTRYPAACYRYRAGQMLRALGRSRRKLTVECLSLIGARRLGCFHGLGRALTSRVIKKPDRLAKYCGHGTADDQAMCIEGVIEKLADYDQARAFEACTGVTGANTELCEAAAEEKMYRIGKPTAHLYSRN